jgi:hypothetical protein
MARYGNGIHKEGVGVTELRKLRMDMVGGGPIAFIGPVHRMASEC